MVIIRLSRGSSKNRPFFNVVVADSRNRRDGRFIERVGFYNPVAPEGQESLRLLTERITHWQEKGAQLSETVSKLVKRAGVAAKVCYTLQLGYQHLGVEIAFQYFVFAPGMFVIPQLPALIVKQAVKMLGKGLHL